MSTCAPCLLVGGLQVAFLGDAPVSSGDASHLMEWKEVSRRVLLRRSGESNLSVGLVCCLTTKKFSCT